MSHHAESLQKTTQSSPWNVPNSLSAARLVLAIAVCVLIDWHWWRPAWICFIVAASTDWVDGWWARKFNAVTKLGRILDPFVDKIIICGSMIALSAISNSHVPAWMSIVIVGRELLVTSLRGMVEGQGGDFSAKQLGKWKMVAQCIGIVSALIQLEYDSAPPWIAWTTFVSLWVAIALTIVSGIEYVLIVLRPTKPPSEAKP